MKSINPKATRDYVCACDRDKPSEEQTVWKIGQLSMAEQALIKDLSGAGGTQIKTALDLGLLGADNFTDESGNPIPWKRDSAKRPILGDKKPWLGVLDRISMKEADELAAEVIKGADLETAEIKNS